MLDQGEVAIANDDWHWFLHEDTGYWHRYLKEFGGMGILWEHRYYGESSPFKLTPQTKPSEMQYQSVEQALADVSAFTARFTHSKYPDVDLTPASTPWIFIGGSYSGYRAALLREVYPQSIFASWAASAPVQYNVDMSIYYYPVLQGMQNLGWGNCSNDVGAAIRYMDEIMEDEESAAKLKRSFLGPGAGRINNSNFVNIFTNIFTNWQGYLVDTWYKDPLPEWSVRHFCNWIEKDPVSQKEAPAEGWAASRGAKYIVNRWRAWPTLLKFVNNYYATCQGPYANGSSDLSACYWSQWPSTYHNDIAWDWQYCSQFGKGV